MCVCVIVSRVDVCSFSFVIILLLLWPLRSPISDLPSPISDLGDRRSEIADQRSEIGDHRSEIWDRILESWTTANSQDSCFCYICFMNLLISEDCNQSAML